MAGLFMAATITVVLHNTAQVANHTVSSAQRHVSEIFAELALGIEWRDDTPDCGATILVLLRRNDASGPGGNSAAVLGTTVVGEGGHGGTAYVFIDPIVRFAHAHHQPVELLLAYTIAHEIGHVVLTAPAHTTTGLMKPTWNEDDLRRLMVTRRFFTDGQTPLAAIIGR
jgi:hypothetical protein